MNLCLDVDNVNPIGWRRNPTPLIGIRVRLAALNDATTWQRLEQVAETVGHDRLVVLVDAGGQPGAGTRSSARRRIPRSIRQAARQHQLNVELLHHDDGRGSDERGNDARGRQLQRLTAVVVDPRLDDASTAWPWEVAARRLPIMGNLVDAQMSSGTLRSGGTTDEIADEIAAIADQTRIEDVDNPHHRELFGVRLRRAAIEARGDRRAADDIAVAVLMATNRPQRLPEALRQIEAQTYPHMETVMAIHGTIEAQLRAALLAQAQRRLTIIEVDADRTLGEVLNAAVEASSVPLVTKMDDDDLYAPEHIADLVDAWSYSGAQLVGKGSEFVYLAEIDTTIRRFPHGVETANRNLAGGTLLISREDLQQAGGWRAQPRAVDQALIDDVIAAGGRFHRTHGLGFVLNRHGTAHTWDAPVDYFLQQAVAQWPGVALDAAGW